MKLNVEFVDEAVTKALSPTAIIFMPTKKIYVILKFKGKRCFVAHIGLSSRFELFLMRGCLGGRAGWNVYSDPLVRGPPRLLE